MDTVLRFLAIWLAVDALILGSIWYVVVAIKPLCPVWWEETICDSEPYPTL